MLSNVENEYFQIVFFSNAYLVKAHKLVNFMPEDIDSKIQLKNSENFNRTCLNKELKINTVYHMESLS